MAGNSMKTLVFLAKGFEMMEFAPFVDVLGWARNDYGVDVTVETGGFTQEVISTFGVKVTVDKLLEDICIDDYAALAIPGGFEEFGFYEEAYDERFLELIREFDREGKLIASICVGALPLGKSGILKGRKATTYHLRDGYREKELAEFGVKVINEPIVLDGNVITSWCPETAAGVAFSLLERLTTEEQMFEVKAAMGYLDKNMEKQWMDLTVELQSLAQSALHYCKDKYDIERFQRIRDISAEMAGIHSTLPVEKISRLFCNETGYQTPKLDTRAAIFQDNKVLLVQEVNGEWSLPGGWMDVGLTVKENTIKEVKEEAGLDVTADLLIAVQDRDRYNKPIYLHKICKIFVLCTNHGGSFKPNLETIGSGYFDLEDLPPLEEAKNTVGQIRMCFEAYHAKEWKTRFD